jgi:tRNA-dihydrouridine synthase A
MAVAGMRYAMHLPVRALQRWRDMAAMRWACWTWRLSVAPMMDWTDRHCRYFHRLLTRRTRLYTEMVTTGALLHGDVPRHLDFERREHPVALQLGGSEPAIWRMRAAGRALGLRRGQPQLRLPQRTRAARRLRRLPDGRAALVADCVAAMRDACARLPVTVKHRIGIDRIESYDFVRDFVGTVAEAGCTVFIVHARNAWLKGLSPKENREVPPLRYELVHRLKRDFPALTIVINGGITTATQIAEQLAQVDGVMVGREAYHDPWSMAGWDARFWAPTAPPPVVDAPGAVEKRWWPTWSASRRAAHGTPWARRWRHDRPATCWACGTDSRAPAAGARLAQEQHAHRGRGDRQQHGEHAGLRRRHVAQAPHPQPHGGHAGGQRIEHQQHPGAARTPVKSNCSACHTPSGVTSARPHRLISALMRRGDTLPVSRLPITT